MGTLKVDNITKVDGSPAGFTDGLSVGTGASISSPGSNILTLGTNNTEKLRIASAGQIGLGGANYGSAGQAIVSNGSGSAPTWQDVFSYGTISHTNIDIRERNGGASLGGGLSNDGGNWVKIGNQVHLWGHVTTSAGTGGNTNVVALAILDTNLPEIVNDGRNPYGPCVGSVSFNAQGNFSNLVGAYVRGPSSSNAAATREFGLYVETQAGNSLETTTKYCTVEDIGSCAFNFDVWYECTP